MFLQLTRDQTDQYRHWQLQAATLTLDARLPLGYEMVTRCAWNAALMTSDGSPRGPFDPGPHPGSSSVQMSTRMGRVKRRDNGPEVAVRRLLHARGLRYRVAWPVPGQRRRTIDIAFTRTRLAVYLDGCFWHGCPIHGTAPKANSAWWSDKIATNRARDADVTAQLQAMGWTVMRFWEHDDPAAVAAQISNEVRVQGA